MTAYSVNRHWERNRRGEGFERGQILTNQHKVVPWVSVGSRSKGTPRPSRGTRPDGHLDAAWCRCEPRDVATRARERILGRISDPPLANGCNVQVYDMVRCPQQQSFMSLPRHNEWCPRKHLVTAFPSSQQLRRAQRSRMLLH